MNILKNDTVFCTKRRLFLLFALNTSDWLCTLSLVSTGCFEEANPLMKKVIAEPLLGLAVKIIIPYLFIVYALSRTKTADSKQILVSNNIVLFGICVYVAINLYHILCFTLLHIAIF